MRFTGINILLLSEPLKKKIDSDFLNGLQTWTWMEFAWLFDLSALLEAEIYEKHEVHRETAALKVSPPLVDNNNLIL